ncbi:hypothetical protein BU17DRAFT_95269 [Hysterangium stoloniferum]|nr:hypothetical protein BU17DRAFT_95269 [Hysterangium stoloniferum]
MDPLPRLTQACAECKRMKHETIDTLKARVRQLEDALEATQTQHSYEQSHPLLSDELRRVAATPLPSSAEDKHDVQNTVDEELAENVGTLALDDKGTQYFSSMGAFAYFWKTVQTSEDSSRKQKMDLVIEALRGIPHEISHLAYVFPTPLTDLDIAATIDVQRITAHILQNCLPPYPEAWSLFENYWEHCSWHIFTFTREKFVNQILSPIYRRSSGGNDQTPLCHNLALLFMVFAIGDLMDFTKPFDLKSALHYCLLARACLCLTPVIESPTLTALQAMHLMSVFGLMSHDIIGQEQMWLLSGMNFKLAITLGLHYDPTKFNLPADEVHNRQYVMAAIVIQELLLSLSLGRPPSLSLGNITWIRPSYCEIPGTDITGRYWGVCFIRDCTQKVLETMVAPKPISYNKILQLDKIIKEYPMPDPVDIPNLESAGVGEKLGATFLFMIKEINFLFLHRRCFALALRDHPDDPLRSAFAPSVRACYQSATTVITQMSIATESLPQITERIWFVWPNVLVSTLILGAIVARSPGCALASSAFLELEKASRLWESVSDVSGPKMRDKLRQLKQKACTAFAQYHATNSNPLIPGLKPGGLEVIEEISALGGYVGGKVTLTSKTNGSSRFGEEASLTCGSVASSPQGTTPPAGDSPDYFPETRQSFSQAHPSNYTTTNYGLPHLPDPQNFPKENSPVQIQLQSQVQVPQEALRDDFNDIFGFVGDQGLAPPVISGNDILKQLGLMEEWQPAMDHLGF